MDGKIIETKLGRTLFVMATEAEYGEHLQAQFEPFICGVGPVEAALNTAIRLSAARGEVDAIVSIGSAGSAVFEQGTILQVASVSYRDMNASAFGFPAGQTPFAEFGPIIELETLLDGVPSAAISTGADVVTPDGYGAIDAEMVDMESFALVRCARKHDVGFLGLRRISDGKAPVERYEDWTAWLSDIDRGLAEALSPIFLRS
ncbi:5'-methylthioadenosine/S-adenosylhomocysteine nucleosidase [Rhizobiaceae bacterium]|nr:5'-methylthioadenosine/S-adenosylhomocysteine nucleosidase [Rhizobiaceae bacterium]